MTQEEKPVSPDQEPSTHEKLEDHLHQELRAVAAGGAVTPTRIHGPTSPHLILNPVWLPPAKGFAHVVVPARGLLVFLGGQAGHRPDGTLAGESLLDQFEQSCSNVVEALAAAGGKPEHLVSVQIFVTDGREYRNSLREIGERWRRHFQKHYPAISLLEVRSLFDPNARVELLCTAVIPDEPHDEEQA